MENRENGGMDLESQRLLANRESGESSTAGAINDISESLKRFLEAMIHCETGCIEHMINQYPELFKMLDDLHDVLRKDCLNRDRNVVTLMARRLLFAVGVIFALWPSLLVFDFVLRWVYFLVATLQQQPQDICSSGFIARVSGKIARFAEGARITGTMSIVSVMLGYLGFVVGLRYLLAQTTRRWVVLTDEQKDEAFRLEGLIETLIEMGRLCMDGYDDCLMREAQALSR